MAVKPLTWTTKRVKLADLLEWDKNPVQISERDAKELAKSLSKFDHVLPYVAAAPPNGKKGLPLLDGHQRKMVEIQLNKVPPSTLVDVRIPSRPLTPKEREEIVVRLRKNTGQFDFDKLANFFEVDDLLEWGFTEKELTGAGFELGDGSKDAEPQENKAKQLQKRWGTESGQCWAIGSHRLVIGDCLEYETVNLLFAGKRADCVVTDPPYAIYGSSTGIGGDVTDNNMVRPFMRDVAGVIEEWTRLGSHCYVFCDWRSYSTWWDEIKKREMVIRNCIVWDKGDGGMGSMYTMRHEFIVFFERLEKAISVSKANKGRKARTVHGRANVQRFNVPQERFHNAVKPVDLLNVFIEASSDEGEIVFDPFCGSASTMVACQNLGRKCYTSEVNENFAAVSLQRMADAFPDLKIERVKDGKK